jgi:heme oxygenase
MVLTRLRQCTRTQHERLERGLALLDAVVTAARYRALLTRMYGLYEPLERALAVAQAHVSIDLDLAARRKVPLLETDLATLGLSSRDIGALPRCRALPPLDTAPQVMGCLYVLEGSMLGGQVITRALHDALGLTPERGAAFFAGYGAATGARWRGFREMLEDFSGSDAERVDAIVGSASATFDCFERWLLSEASAS